MEAERLLGRLLESVRNKLQTVRNTGSIYETIKT